MRRNTKLKIKFYDTCALLNLGEKVFGGEPFAVSSITFKELEIIKTSFNKDNDVKAMARHLLHLFDENEYDYIPVVHQVENEYLSRPEDLKLTMIQKSFQTQFTLPKMKI